MAALLRRIFSRKTLVRLVFFVVALVTLLVAVIVIENRRGEHAWAAYRTAAEKRGERLQLADFISPVVPDAENYAAIPAIQEAFAASAAGKPIPNPFAWPENWQEPGPKLARRLSGERLDLAQWRDSFLAAHLLPQSTDDPARDVLTALARYEPVLQQFHDAAQRPHAHFPVKWERNISAQIPHLSIMLSAVRLHALRMGAHLALGDSAAAYADWRDGLGLYHALEHEPVLTSGLERVAILIVLVECGVWDGLAGRQWSDAELRAIAVDLSSLDLLADLRFSLASERGGLNSSIDAIRAMVARDRQHLFSFINSPELASSPAFLIGGWLYPAGWYRQSQVKMNELYDRRLGQIDLTHGRFLREASSDEDIVGLRSAGAFTRYRYALAALMMPALDGVGAKFALTQTTVQEARIACALELFRRAHGAFPEHLDELVPSLLDAIPRDVMDGAPIRYRRTAEGFELWGVGYNGHDDGGKYEAGRKVVDQLDWLWHP